MTGNRLGEWPVADVERLRALIGEDLSARQIGIIMGRTRNAIIGKVSRVGLILNGGNGGRHGRSGGRPRKPRISAMEPTKRRQTNFNLSLGRERRVVRLPWARAAADPIIPINGEGITILELRGNQCHTVVGSSRPTKGLPRYCGHLTWNDTAYCEGHYAAFHNPNYR